MPAHDGLGLDDEQRFAPSRPVLHERYPESPVDVVQAGARALASEYCHLLAEGDVLDDEVGLRGKRCAEDPNENMDWFNHGGGEGGRTA